MQKRWYDVDPRMGTLLEKLRNSEEDLYRQVIHEIKNIITKTDPDLIDRTVDEYPEDYNRRWYDCDPTSWMTINALQYANPALVEEVLVCLESHLKV